MSSSTAVKEYGHLHAKRPALRVLFMSGYTDYAMHDETIVERGT